MASVESLGLGSGVLTTNLVDQLITAEREATEKRITSQQELVTARISAYGEVKSQVSTLRSAISALKTSSSLGSTTATSSKEDILTATASSLAAPGTTKVEVQQIAKSHALASGSFASIDEVVGEGKLEFRFGTTNYTGGGAYDSFDVDADTAGKTITIDSSNNTLSGIRDAINNGDFGVKANIVYDGTGYRLTFASEKTGEAKSMEIVAKNADNSLATTGISALAFSASQSGAGNMQQTQKAEDALLMVDGLQITRDTNAVTGVIAGVTLNLAKAEVGTEVSVNISADISGITDKINAFIEAYNALKETSATYTSYDSKTRQAGLLLGDSTLRSIMNQTRSLLTQTVSGLSGHKYASFAEVGLYTDQNDSFKMKFDSAKFTAALEDSRESVMAIFGTTGSSTDSRVSYLSSTINTKPGTYDVNITQLATQGKYTGGSVSALDFAVPVIINSANDTFRIGVNDTSTTVNLTQGSYASGADLAKEIQLQINSARAIKAKGYGVTVAYDAAHKSFNITSNKYGSTSQVYFQSVDSNSANSLGFSAPGVGGFTGRSLSTLNSDYFNGWGASTVKADRPVLSTTGINFATDNATFSIAVDGNAPVAVTVNQNAAGADLNGDSVYGDRKDVLQAIQNAIDATALNGQIIASFTDDDRLQFTTTAVGDARSIEITAAGASASDVLLGLKTTDGPQSNGKDAGINFPVPVNFKLNVDNILTANDIALPAGTYNSGNDLAAALKTAIDTGLAADPNFVGVTKGAETGTGSRDISTPIDFSSANAGFTLSVNGVETDILVTANSGDSIVDVQTALDAALGAGVVTASLDGTGLKLTTVATGHEQFMQVVSDGRGARSSNGAVINSGIDFSGANNATFDLTVDGITMAVDVNADASAGDGDDSLAAIQAALDTALVNSSSFAAGDVVAKRDAANNVYFETKSRDGVKTANTFGSGASIQISNLNANATTTLGLVAETQNNGYDAFGMDNDIDFGYDLISEVTYSYDAETDKGGFTIKVGGNSTTVSIDSPQSEAIAFLGLHEPDGTESQVKKGLDVAGTINGVEATGSGQNLVAQDGNTKATNGYYIASQSDIVNNPVTIDGTNDTFTITLNDVETSISIANGIYSTGEALASAIQTAISGNADISAKSYAVKVEYTSDTASALYGKISIISGLTGEDSKVLLSDVSTATSNALGFVNGQADGEAGKDQVGAADDASGLKLRIAGGDLGERGSVTYVKGIADGLYTLFDNFLNSNSGSITKKLDALNDQSDALDNDLTTLNTRMAAKEELLKSQFLLADKIISQLKNTGDYLTQQFEAMSNANKK